jgi:hypothetical protein
MLARPLQLQIMFEDGATERVAADQRDAVVFEREMKTGYVTALDTMPVTLFRFLAWHASVRTGRVDPKRVKRSEWEAAVVAVEPAGDPAEPDPTGRPVPPGGDVFNSPLPPGRVSSRSSPGGNPKT